MLLCVECFIVILSRQHFHLGIFFFFFKQKTAYEIRLSLVGSEMCIRDSFKRPVILINYPKDIKAFYMKQNDDGKTVRAMDVLFPGIGEIIGGSEREADYGKLHARVAELGMNEKELWWYLDTLSLIHISEPTRLRRISYAVFCLKKKKQIKKKNK